MHGKRSPNKKLGIFWYIHFSKILSKLRLKVYLKLQFVKLTPPLNIFRVARYFALVGSAPFPIHPISALLFCPSQLDPYLTRCKCFFLHTSLWRIQCVYSQETGRSPGVSPAINDEDVGASIHLFRTASALHFILFVFVSRDSVDPPCGDSSARFARKTREFHV